MGRWRSQLAAGVVLVWAVAALAPITSRAQEREARTPARADIWDAPAAVPVVRYDIDVRLDPALHRIDGKAVVVWRNGSRVPQSELYLHLYLNAFKNDRSIFMRSPAGAGFRGEGLPSRWGWTKVDRLFVREMDQNVWPDVDPRTPGDEHDETDVRVPLPRAVEPGGQITLELDWIAELPSIVLRTGFFESFHMVAQWFPKLARLEPDGRWAHFPFQRLSEFYSDYGDYDVRIEVPDGFEIGATGKEQGDAVQRGGSIVRRFVARRVGDFAFAAWDGFRSTRRALSSGGDLRCLFPDGYEDVAELELDLVEQSLELLGARYGAYPYDTLTVVHPPRGAREAGGMEYPTLITTGGHWMWPRVGARLVEIVTIHELTHQWFYGLVGSNENAWPFLDEGLTEWASGDVAETLWPTASGMRAGHVSLAMPAAERNRMLSTSSRGPIAQPANDFASGGDYGAIVYGRTATILETLARVYGRDALRGALGRYARRHRFGHPTPGDLVTAVGEVLGDGVAAVLRAALFESGWVDYQIVAVANMERRTASGLFGDPEAPAAPGNDLSDTGWALVRNAGTLRLPVEIELYDADGGVTRAVWDGASESQRIAYRGEARLVAAVVDPDRRVLLDENLANNARRADAGTSSSPRVFGLVSTLAQAALAVLLP